MFVQLVDSPLHAVAHCVSERVELPRSESSDHWVCLLAAEAAALLIDQKISDIYKQWNNTVY